MIAQLLSKNSRHGIRKTESCHIFASLYKASVSTSVKSESSSTSNQDQCHSLLTGVCVTRTECWHLGINKVWAYLLACGGASRQVLYLPNV